MTGDGVCQRVAAQADTPPLASPRPPLHRIAIERRWLREGIRAQRRPTRRTGQLDEKRPDAPQEGIGSRLGDCHSTFVAEPSGQILNSRTTGKWRDDLAVVLYRSNLPAFFDSAAAVAPSQSIQVRVAGPCPAPELR